MRKKVWVTVIGVVLISLACGPLTTPTENAEVIFQDDFSTQNGFWVTAQEDPGIIYEYSNGAYRLTAVDEAVVFSSAPTIDFPADVRVEVDLTQTAGTYNTAMGIVCRLTYTSEGNSMYFLYITKDGTAMITKYVYDQKTLLAGSDEILSAVHAGNVTNHLRADCSGNSISLYVNGTRVLSVTDESLVSGAAGVMIGTADIEDAVVLFDNFVVTRP